MKFLALIKKTCLRIPEWIWVIVVYLFIHLPSLTLLPVFADEAIYIRWAQLIQDDMARYAFFSMADGKPPFFMWLLSIVLRFGSDPLLVGRLFSVGIGLLTVFALRSLVAQFTTSTLSRAAVTFAAIVLPFWFFYHRMVLMDGLLTLLLTCSFFCALELSKAVAGRKKSRIVIRHVVSLALSFGLAMMTKTPALFAIPIIALTPVYVWWDQGKRSLSMLLRSVAIVGIAGGLGMLLFFSLRISPLFGALFSRSGDFTFTTHDLLSGEWKYVFLESFPHNIMWLLAYLTPELCLISIFGLFFPKTRAKTLFLLICAFLFLSPLTLVGRVLWPRYFLPVAIFMTLAFGVSISQCAKHAVLRTVCIILLFIMSVRCAYFICVSLSNVARIPFVIEDEKQYISEWSAGYGNKEVRDFIVEQQAHLPSDGSRKIIVLTEGSFGTLPDGLLMYFHYGNAKNLEIHGIGVSIPKIPDEYIQKTQTNDVYYMVNSHRFRITDAEILKKVFEVKRPNGPSLLFYKVGKN